MRIAWVALVFAGGSAVAQSRPPSPYPPPGQMEDAGGYRVHLVQPEVAKTTRVCTYDAGGMAWSDPGPAFTCQSRVDEIHALLRNAKIEGPLVLVGLSVGALVSRWYATSYPAEVTGIVMVDHAFLNPAGGGMMGAGEARVDSGPVVVQQAPISITAEDSSKFTNLPERSQKLHRWAASLHPVMPTVEAAEACAADLQSRERGPHPLGDKPLVVVSTANRNRNYRKLQEELLALSTRSEQLMATESFHSVEIDEPDVVVTAIELVVEKARQSVPMAPAARKDEFGGLASAKDQIVAVDLRLRGASGRDD